MKRNHMQIVLIDGNSNEVAKPMTVAILKGERLDDLWIHWADVIDVIETACVTSAGSAVIRKLADGRERGMKRQWVEIKFHMD